jgi:hypothetical protein
MSSFSTASNEKSSVSWLDRVILLPTLMHLSILFSCPDGDIRVARMLGVLMWLSATWECVLFSNAARVMLSPDASWQLAFVALGLLIAVIMLLADAIVFIAASWHAHGLAEVERTHEFKLPTSHVGRIKTASLFGGRFVMAVLIANFMAGTAALLAFEKDIGRILERNYQTANATILSEAAQREDTELRKNKEAQLELGEQVSQMEAEERDLRALNLDPRVDEAELRLAMQHLATAQAAKVAADRELKNARVYSARELGGECDGLASCVAGQGPRWRAAQEQIALAEREASAALRSLGEVQKRIRELTETRDHEARRKEGIADIRLTEVRARKSELESRLAGLRSAYDTRLASREANIRGMVERDPRHTPRSDGLLVRLQALMELSKDESVAYALYGFDAILILLELAAVMGKTFALIPMTYATRIVELDLARAIETGRRLKDIVDGNQPVPDIPIGTVADTAKPEDTTAPVASGPQPMNGANRPLRHKPRWRPPSDEGPIEPANGT